MRIVFTACAFNQFNGFIAEGEGWNAEEAKAAAHRKAKQIIADKHPLWRVKKLVPHREMRSDTEPDFVRNAMRDSIG